MTYRIMLLVELTKPEEVERRKEAEERAWKRNEPGGRAGNLHETDENTMTEGKPADPDGTDPEHGEEHGKYPRVVRNPFNNRLEIHM